MKAPLILGAGPAGCAAAICLGKAGVPAILIDRDPVVGDALCGGFMSWATARSIAALGLDLAELGAHRVEHLRLFARDSMAESKLPAPAYGLSRKTFDTALRKRALAAGAQLRIDHARRIVPGVVEGERQNWPYASLFMGCGKHDVRGEGRPRVDGDPALGLRIRLPAHTDLNVLIGDAIELHLFRSGYAGIVLHEDGSANVCLAVRKSRLAESGGNPRDLLTDLANEYPHFAARLGSPDETLPIDSIAAVPYGWVAQDTAPGVFRLGDQAAVIPSLAGEGIGIALASGMTAAGAWLRGGAGAAPRFQRTFASRVSRPVSMAGLIWRIAESGTGARVMTGLARHFSAPAELAMRWSRITA